MIILKQVTHYPDTNSVEATWVDRIQPADILVPAVDAVLDEEGNVVTQAVAAYWMTPEPIDVQVKCHSYDQVQMDMLRADLGDDAANQAEIFAAVESNFKPPVPKSAEDMQAEINAESLAYLASTDWMVIRFAETGVAIPAEVMTKRQTARDAVK